MGDIYKIWEKDGWLFETHSFTNSNLEYPSKQRIFVNPFFSKFFYRKQGTFRSTKSNFFAFPSFFKRRAGFAFRCCTCSDSQFDLKTKKKITFCSGVSAITPRITETKFFAGSKNRCAKGQIISESLLDVFIWTKKRTKIFL